MTALTDEEFETLGRLIDDGHEAFTPETLVQLYFYARRHRSSPSSALTEITEAADKLVAHLLRIRLTQSQEWIRCDCCGMWWGKSEAAKHAPHCQVDAYLKVRQPTLPEPPK